MGTVILVSYLPPLVGLLWVVNFLSIAHDDDKFLSEEAKNNMMTVNENWTDADRHNAARSTHKQPQATSTGGR
jgi:hypothetical protein